MANNIWPLATKSLRTCAALAASRARTSPALPSTCLVPCAVAGCQGMPISSAQLLDARSKDRSFFRTGIDGAHNARGAIHLASATRRARSSTSALAPGPAISKARISTSSDKAKSSRTDRLSPWRNAFCAERARPLAVFGPVLARAFARLARILDALVTPSSFDRFHFDDLYRPPRSARWSAARAGPAIPDGDRSRAAWRCGEFPPRRSVARSAR